MFDKGDDQRVHSPHCGVFEKMRPLWTVKKAASYLGIPERTLRDLVFRRGVPFRKVGRSLRFCPDEIEKWSRPQKEE